MVGETMTDFDPLTNYKEGQTYEYAMEFTSVKGERDKAGVERTGQYPRQRGGGKKTMICV